MKQMKLGGALQAPVIGIGCMRISGLEIKDAANVIDTAIGEGLNFFDHADIYGGGQAEVVFSEALAQSGHKREDVILQSKCAITGSRRKYDFCGAYYDFSKKHIIEATEGILKRLKTDYLDTLLLHRPDTLMEPEEVAEAFDQLASQGKVRYFGVSNQSPDMIRLLQKYLNQRLIIDQLQLSPAHTPIIDQQIYVNTSEPQAVGRTSGILEYCRYEDITIQAWSPFQYGFFEGTFFGSDKYPELNMVLNDMAKEKGVTPEAIAIAWMLRHPAKIQPIIGSMNVERIKNVAKAVDVEITREEWYELYCSAGNMLP